MTRYFLFLFFVLLSSLSIAQIKGTITDTQGDPLAFASIYIQGTSQGTSSNVEGVYELALEKGTYDLVFQYVGYQTAIKSISVGAELIKLDIQLQEESIGISEVVVSADAEDPAYAVIRKAMEKRTYFKDLIPSYSCNVYIKGNQKVLDAPTSILGTEIGDMEGSLDSNRQGIIYLSESEAELHVDAPDKKREIMHSSKVSGNDNGFSFNRATLMDFSFYENAIDFGRKIISPIGNGAMFYYKYKLLGTIYDSENRLINKIQVIPKREDDPVFHGLIYIVEDDWNIQSCDLRFTGKSINQPVLDTVSIKQQFIPIAAPDKWVMLQQSINFKLGIFGFKFQGNFTGIFSEYQLDPDFSDDFFSNEILIVEEGANEKSAKYWEETRPIPLTAEEDLDYVKKDSLQILRASKPYRDSVDQVNNKFKIMNILTGYSFNRSYKRQYFSIAPPPTTLQFNTLQGLSLNLDMTYRKEFDENNIKWFEINPVLQYGFGDEKLRYSVDYTQNFNRTNFSRLRLSAGKRVVQYNENEPIDGFVNTAYTLFEGQNYLKAYDKSFVKLFYRQEISNGILFRGKLEMARRIPLLNITNFTWADNAMFTSNDPLMANSKGERAFDMHYTFNTEFSLRFRFKQEYLSYPGRKFVMGSKYPDFTLMYKKGWTFLDVNSTFDQVKLKIEDDYLSVGYLGYSAFSLEGGLFLRNENMQFIDYQHFNGNQTLVGNPSKYLEGYKLLPYYDFSTNEHFISAHWEHYWEGFILDRIPLIRKLGWQSVIGGHLLYTPEQNNYWEFSVGIDNIGFKAIRLLRIDWAFAFHQANFTSGFRIGFKL